MDMETFNILAQGLQQREVGLLVTLLNTLLDHSVQVRLVIVANTGRCGSTLLAQMFESVPGQYSAQSIFCTVNILHSQYSAQLSFLNNAAQVSAQYATAILKLPL